MRFKELDEPVFSTEVHYDLFEGYIDPRKMLVNPERAEEVLKAINLITQFLDEAEECGALEVG